MSSNRLKHIAISEENYFKLKDLGHAGDSFNDVLTEILRSKKAAAASAQEDSQG